MRIVIALGGNALLRRGQVLSAENQRENIKIACKEIAKVHANNELIIVHGNGPQVGLLALQNLAYKDTPAYPLDVLGAETVGMIGYMIQQELGNLVAKETSLSTVLTQVEVDLNDPAFAKPTKPIGPVYSREEVEKLTQEKKWEIAPDGDKYRRVVPSPLPKRIFEIKPIKWLLEKGSIVICAGGGGIPTYFDENNNLCGVEAVIDKDLCSALLAEKIKADLFVIATDVKATFINWGEKDQKAIANIHPDALADMNFAAGSMGPKVQAVINFVSNTGKDAVIGSLSDIVEMVSGKAGTRISKQTKDTIYY